MKRDLRTWLKAFVVELALYAALVAGYFYLVLRFLANWLNALFATDRKLYATLALVFIICQGVLLEIITRWLIGTLKRHTED